MSKEQGSDRTGLPTLKKLHNAYKKRDTAELRDVPIVGMDEHGSAARAAGVAA